MGQHLTSSSRLCRITPIGDNKWLMGKRSKTPPPDSKWYICRFDLHQTSETDCNSDTDSSSDKATAPEPGTDSGFNKRHRIRPHQNTDAGDSQLRLSVDSQVGHCPQTTKGRLPDSPSVTTLLSACRLLALIADLQAATTLLAADPTLSRAACCIMRLMFLRPSSSCCWLAARLLCSTHMSRFRSATCLRNKRAANEAVEDLQTDSS